MSLQEWFTLIVGQAAITTPLVVGLIELVKRTWTSLAERFYPILAVVVGMAINELVALRLGQDWRDAAFIGLIAGLIAAGIFQYGKARETESRIAPPRG